MKKLLSILLLSLSSLAFANDTLKIIVPFAPGGNTDVTARLYAKELANQNIDAVVINRTGADGKVAVTEFFNTPPDGKTVLLGGNGSIVYPGLENKEYYENTKRLVPVMQAAVFGSILVSRKDSPIQTLDQLFAAVKTRPVSIGVGSSVYKSLINDIFGDNPNVIVVPFGGDAPTSLALQNKTVDVAFVTFLYGPRLLSSDHTGIAVSTDTSMFGVKTFREQGVNVMRDQWIGFFAAPGTSNEALGKMYAALEKARQSPELYDAVTNQMHSIVAKRRTPKEFATYIENDYRRLLKLMK